MPDKTKEISPGYILVTYDLPASAKAVRRKFLTKALEGGAMMHTASCYLMPETSENMALAEELATIANVYIFTANVPHEHDAVEIHSKYGDHLLARCKALDHRLLAEQTYIQSDYLGIAAKMGAKTGKMLQQLAHIAKSYQEPWFLARLENLVTNWKQIHSGGGEGG